MHNHVKDSPYGESVFYRCIDNLNNLGHYDKAKAVSELLTEDGVSDMTKYEEVPDATLAGIRNITGWSQLFTGDNPMNYSKEIGEPGHRHTIGRIDGIPFMSTPAHQTSEAATRHCAFISDNPLHYEDWDNKIGVIKEGIQGFPYIHIPETDMWLHSKHTDATPKTAEEALKSFLYAKKIWR